MGPPWRGCTTCGGGAPAPCVPTPRIAYVPEQWAQKIGEAGVWLTEARNRAALTCRAGDVETVRWQRGWSSWRGRCRDLPGSWIPRIDAGSCCGGVEGVRQAGVTPAAKNCGGGGTYPRCTPGTIPAKQGLGSGTEGSANFLSPRRSCCAAWPGLRCSGAAWPRQSRGAARWSGAELGFLGGGCGWEDRGRHGGSYL